MVKPVDVYANEAGSRDCKPASNWRPMPKHPPPILLSAFSAELLVFAAQAHSSEMKPRESSAKRDRQTDGY
jgi:hypothetical protein